MGQRLNLANQYLRLAPFAKRANGTKTIEVITAKGKLCRDTARSIVANSMRPITYKSNKLS